MKKTIEIPEELVERAKRGAKILGISWREFVARALIEYIKTKEAE